MSNKGRFNLSMNEAAVDIFDEMLEMVDVLKGRVIETELGPIILDLGVKTQGSYLAGEYITQITMGGFAEIALSMRYYDQELTLPAISVFSDFPTYSTMGSQYAGWQINKNNYQAMASGPARILAKKPKELYDFLTLTDDYDSTVIVLEAKKYPPDAILKYIAEKCNIPIENLNVIIAPTSSLAGSVQISGRSIETAIHKLHKIGFNIQSIISASGIAPISSLFTNNDDRMLGRTNDMLIYGADVLLHVNCKNDEEITTHIDNAVSRSSSEYGNLFYELVKKANGNFYNIDPNIFSPAKLTINNLITGNIITSGIINVDKIKETIRIK